MRHANITALLLLTSIARTVHAQSEADRSQARDLGETAFVALDHKDWVKAEDLFRRADSLYHAPTLLLGLARAEAQLGKFVEAWAHYHRILVEGPPVSATPQMIQAIKDANAEIGTVETRRASVTIHVRGPAHPQVTLDGQPVPVAALDGARPVNPGNHSLRAVGDGFVAKETAFEAAEGQAIDTTLTLDVDSAPLASPVSPASSNAHSPGPLSRPASSASQTESTSIDPRRTRLTLALASLGVGAVGLGVGAGAGFTALAKHNDLGRATCAGSCASNPVYQQARTDFFTWATVSTVGFIVGAVGVAGGGVLWLTAPRATPLRGPIGVAPIVGPRIAGVRVIF